MTADEVLAEVRQRGIEIWAEEAVLRFRPKCAMVPDLAALVTAHRSEILAALSPALGILRAKPEIRRPSHRPSVPDSILADPPAWCSRCHSGRVLAELRTMTGGLCYECWEKDRH